MDCGNHNIFKYPNVRDIVEDIVASEDPRTNYTYAQFNRRYVIRIIGADDTTRVFDSLAVKDPLNISFVCHMKSDNTSVMKLSMFNIAHETKKLLNTKQCIVELYAGYANSPLTLLYTGDVFGKCVTKTVGADYETTVNVKDGYSIHNIAISRAIPAGMCPEKVFERICADIRSRTNGRIRGSAIASMLVWNPKKVTSYSYHGNAAKVLTEFLNEYHYDWTIIKGVIVLSKRGTSTVGLQDAEDTGVFKLTPETGLRTRPQPTQGDADLALNDLRRSDGITFVATLNPLLQPTQPVLVEVEGKLELHMITESKFKGNYAGKQWDVELSTTEIKA